MALLDNAGLQRKPDGKRFAVNLAVAAGWFSENAKVGAYVKQALEDAGRSQPDEPRPADLGQAHLHRLRIRFGNIEYQQRFRPGAVNDAVLYHRRHGQGCRISQCQRLFQSGTRRAGRHG